MAVDANNLDRNGPEPEPQPYQNSISNNNDRFSVSNTVLAAMAVLVAILTLFKTWKVWKYCRRRRARASPENLEHGIGLVPFVLVPFNNYQHGDMIYHNSLAVQYLAVSGESSRVRPEHE